MTYDTKCYDLAQAFVSDLKIASVDAHNDACKRLAQEIQDTIESFLNYDPALTGIVSAAEKLPSSKEKP